MDLELLIEAERRGILPADKQELLSEARRRGLVPGGGPVVPQRAEEPSAPAPRTNAVEQGISGVNEGLANFAGTPVDLITSAINAPVRALGGPEQLIKDPVGGSQWMQRRMDPFVTDTAPQTRGQRYARRVGQEVGYGAPAALTMAAAPGIGAAARTNMPAYMATNTAADAAAGTAGQTSREVAPENDIMDLVVSLLAGGGTAAGVSGASRSRPPRPSYEDWKSRAKSGYDTAKTGTLTDSAQQDFSARLRATMDAEGGDAVGFPKAESQVRKIEKNPRQSVYNVEEARRRIRDHVAQSAEEGAMGERLMAATDEFLSGLTPQQVVAADPEDVVKALKDARRSSHVYIKHDEIMDAIDEGRGSAEVAGTGGNVLNRQSQEVRKILKKEQARRPGKRGGYTPDEVAAMEKITSPGKAEKVLRSIGRLSPSTGGLQAMATGLGGGGGVMGYALGGNPAWLALSAPAAVGSMAQAAAERMKSGNIDDLVDTILRGGVAAPKKAPDAVNAAIVAQLLAGSLQP